MDELTFLIRFLLYRSWGANKQIIECKSRQSEPGTGKKEMMPEGLMLAVSKQVEKRVTKSLLQNNRQGKPSYVAWLGHIHSP